MAVRDLPPRPVLKLSLKRALGRGRSSMAELRDVTPPVPVRLRPVTPKRMRLHASRTRAAEYRAFNPASQGSSPWRRTSSQPPCGGTGKRAGLRNRCPHGHVRSTRTEGTTSQQSGSSAEERRPHKAKAGGSCPPRTTSSLNQPLEVVMKPIYEDDVCFSGHEQAAQWLPV